MTIEKNDLKICIFDHLAEAFDGRTRIILLKHNDSVALKKATNRLEKLAVNLPVRIMCPYVPLVLIDEMRRIADYQAPLLRSRNAPEVIGLIHRYAILESVDPYSLSTRGHGLGIDIG